MQIPFSGIVAIEEGMMTPICHGSLHASSNIISILGPCSIATWSQRLPLSQSILIRSSSMVIDLPLRKRRDNNCAESREILSSLLYCQVRLASVCVAKDCC